MNRAAPAAQLELVHINALLGRDVRKPTAQIESEALRLLDDNRFIDVMGVSTAVTAAESLEVPVAAGQSQLDAADCDDQVIGSVLCGPSPLGTFVRLVAGQGVIGVGDRAAPLGVLLLDFADRTWDTGFGPVTMAAAVRR
jgi:hypothetical protein